MKTLYLLRHAESPSRFDLEDYERPLSDNGIAQAKAVGEHLKNVNKVLCSSAKRTRTTCKYAFENQGLHNIEFSDDLYNASASTLLQNIQQEQSDHLLVIAHNPGIHMLAYQLISPNDQNRQLDKLSSYYPPCSLAIISCGIESWAELTIEANKLENFIIASHD
ncbi:MAG: phosphoglycerate mutase family protein [Pseudomonadota bacterium]